MVNAEIPAEGITRSKHKATVRVATAWSKLPSKVFLLAFNLVANYDGGAAKHAGIGLFSGVILSNS